MIQFRDPPPDEILFEVFINRLLNADWDAPDCLLKLRADLPLAAVASATFFDQTRLFLRFLDENGGAPLTQTGCLNRAVVARMLERLEWPRRFMKQFEGVALKVVNEEDVFPLHILRIVCGCGGLVRKRKGRLHASHRAKELLGDSAAGTLYRHLFVTFFRRFNLDYLTRMREIPRIQDGFPVTLWRLQIVARDWASLSDLPKEVLLDPVRRQIRDTLPWDDAEEWALEGRVLEPLCWFGLLECDPPQDRWMRNRKKTRYRKTPLFDQFVRL